MEKIRPKGPKFLKELYFNPAAAVVFIVLFLLNMFDIFNISNNNNIKFIYGLFLLVLVVVFIMRTILNFFYKIQISEEIITFNMPFNLYRKRIAFSSIAKFRFKKNKIVDDTLVFFLKSGEIVSVGVKRYSKEQKKYLSTTIKKRSNILNN